MKGFRKSSAPPQPMAVNPQDQSPLFTKFPLDIRRHIYLQLWQDYGLAQHIFAMTEKSYLLGFPCILSTKELNQEPRLPAAPTTPADAGDTPDMPDNTAGADATVDAEQPQSHDDPGDIHGAIQDLTGGDPKPPNITPWCAHFACFRNCSQKWDHSYSLMYSACYHRPNRGGPDLRNSTVLTTFLVCRRIYQEASESLFSKIRFSFGGMVAMDVFLREVPPALVSRVQFVDIISGNMGSLFIDFTDVRRPAQEVYDKVKAAFPKLRELRLALHPERRGEAVPQRQDLEPLYSLARELGNLRKFEIFLPAKCESGSEVGYGDTPLSLLDAPFSVKVVPPGWHPGDKCLHFSSP